MARTRSTASVLCLAAAAAGGLCAPLAGCRGDRSDKPPRRFIPDMDHQPKWKPQSQSEFFVDGRAQRTPDPRTVAFGTADFDPETYADAAWSASFLDERADTLKEDTAFYTGKDASGAYVQYMPVEVTAELIEHGQERFNIYCTPCHGYLADGQGSVAKKGYKNPPANLLLSTYTDRAGATGADGYIFHVARHGLTNPANGQLRMPGYGHALSERDAWAVVAYVRALQTSQNVPIGELTPGQRSMLGPAAGTGGTDAEGSGSGDDQSGQAGQGGGQ